MENERTFKSVDDVSRYINGYRACYVGNGICAPYNRDVLRGWLRELNLTHAQINTFCDEHGVPHERYCDVCDETGDPTCFDGSGICATEHEHDKPYLNVGEHERCEYGQCDERATEICDTCGALLCDAHVTYGDAVDVDGIFVHYTYCRKFACINGIKTVDIVPYITCA